mmetsp:Transcript_70049/g.123484  ORF Transcript_70049/g.123484 Transcript_70049/m.123484 type:complete len:131 (-) Transcript_70049:2744-3136(-)
MLSESACKMKPMKGWHPHGCDPCYLQSDGGARTPRLCLKGQQRGKTAVEPKGQQISAIVTPGMENSLMAHFPAWVLLSIGGPDWASNQLRGCNHKAEPPGYGYGCAIQTVIVNPRALSFRQPWFGWAAMY